MRGYPATSRRTRAPLEPDKRGALGVCRFVEEDPLGSAVELVGFGGTVSYCGEAHAPMFGEATDHVKNDAGLPRLVEVQAVASDYVEEVFQAQTAQRRRLKVSVATRCFSLPAWVRNRPVPAS